MNMDWSLDLDHRDLEVRLRFGLFGTQLDCIYRQEHNLTLHD
jgi:hypothetical protein